MAMWLYQLSPSKELAPNFRYTPKDYRKEVREGHKLEWESRDIWSFNTGSKPKAGDKVIYWFVEKQNDEPGLYGLGIIYEYGIKGIIRHIPIFPSNKLKNKPIHKDFINIIKKIQNRMPIATMFEINN